MQVYSYIHTTNYIHVYRHKNKNATTPTCIRLTYICTDTYAHIHIPIHTYFLMSMSPRHLELPQNPPKRHPRMYQHQGDLMARPPGQAPRLAVGQVSLEALDLSLRCCPSTAGCNPPWMPFIIICPMVSWSR